MSKSIEFDCHIDYIQQLNKELKDSTQHSLLDAYFLGFQIGKNDGNEIAIKKTLYFLLNKSREYHQNEKPYQQKMNAYQKIISLKTSINAIIPKEVDINEVQSLLNKIKEDKNKNNNQISNISSTQHKIIKQEDEQNIQQENSNQISQQVEYNFQLQESQIKQVIQIQDQNQKQEITNKKIMEDEQFLSQINTEVQEEQCEQEYQLNDKLDFLNKDYQQQYQEQLTETNEEQCQICQCDITNQDRFFLIQCADTFHKSCLQEYCINQKQIPIPCPQQGCNKQIDNFQITQICDKNAYQKLDKQTFDNFLMVNSNKYFHCPTSGCEGIYEIEGDIQICTICQKAFCVKCRSPYHEGSCGEESFGKMVKQNLTQCLNCFRWVEKTYGCNHIKCICKYEFCFHCQNQWVGEECKCIELEEQQRRQGFQNFLNQMQQFQQQQQQQFQQQQQQQQQGNNQQQGQ